MTPKLIDLLKKVELISPDKIPKEAAMVFGSGKFAGKLSHSLKSQITGVIESENRLATGALPDFAHPWVSPDKAAGNIILGSNISAFQLEQLKALASSGSENIDKIWLLDANFPLRKIKTINADKQILLIEHGAGVKRHWPHLLEFRQYFARLGYTVTSLCPLMLYSSDVFKFAKATFVWGGQREIYDIAAPFLENSPPTFIEYGFFPQSAYYYLDKKGVSQNCSLMHDDLSWVEQSHMQKLKKVKAQFLTNYAHQAGQYVLVPLQVPDDSNIVNCCRFTHGMQEFIDFIVEHYSTTENIMFKAHPKDPNRDSYDYRGKMSSTKPFLTLLQHAKHVHGITSSTLYEAALAGVDIVIEGTSLLSQHANNLNKLLAAMVERQIPVQTSDISYWLQQHSNLQELT